MNKKLFNTIKIFVIAIAAIHIGVNAQELKANPKNLPFCPAPDDAANVDVGNGGRTGRWHNCWGRYKIEIYQSNKGDVFEGEWADGKPNGYGAYSYLAENQFKGDKYIGEFRDGKKSIRGTYYFRADNQFKGDRYTGEYKNDYPNGLGSYIFSSGIKYVGEWKDGKFSGQGILTYADGSKKEGIFENNIFIREAKVYLPNINTNSSDTVDYRNTNQDRQQLSDEKDRNVVSPSFDCSKAKSFAEKLICSDSQLSALDRELNNYYSRAKSLAENQVDFKKETVNAWTKREKDCFDKACLLSWYASRKAYYARIINNENPNLPNSQALNNEYANIERERQQLAEERRKLEEEKRNREQARTNQRMNLQVSNTQPNNDGDFVINIKTNTDTASLQINGDEQGGKQDGNYSIKRVARAGQTTQFTIIAKDIYGNRDTKTIVVTRNVVNSSVKQASLNPANIKVRAATDAVAIIIGIQNYKRISKADFANQDAQDFYDYASRALGIKQENIKLLMDDSADDVEIIKAFQNWLPLKVKKKKADVYVFYSGHGLPSEDGKSLYILPYGVDRDLINKTAINQQEIIAALQAAQPKSVTMFIDSCYSGQTRAGEALIAGIKPITLKAKEISYPPEFTVITASQPDQLSLASPELKHGIFSFYLMKGMEGDADENKDGSITLGEMQNYLSDMVPRQAMTINRKQMPQLTGDANKILVGK